MCHKSLENSGIDMILPKIVRKDNYLFYIFYHYICLISFIFSAWHRMSSNKFYSWTLPVQETWARQLNSLHIVILRKHREWAHRILGRITQRSNSKVSGSFPLIIQTEIFDLRQAKQSCHCFSNMLS